MGKLGSDLQHLANTEKGSEHLGRDSELVDDIEYNDTSVRYPYVSDGSVSPSMND